MSTDEIEELLRGYRGRGELTRRGYCQQQGIAPSTLDYYLRRYGKPGSKRVRLARVELQPSEEPRFALILANGRRLECEAAGLRELIRAAEGI